MYGPLLNVIAGLNGIGGPGGQELEKKEKIPFRSCGKFIRGIRRGAQGGAIEVNRQTDYGQKYGQASDCILEDLLGPKVAVSSWAAFLDVYAVLAEKIDVGDHQSNK